MEHGSNNSKHYSEPEFNYNVFCYRNEFKWLLRYCFSNSFCWIIDYGYRYCIPGINLCWRIKYTHREWCDIVSMEHRTDNCKYYSEPEFNYNVFCYRHEFKWLFRYSFC